ncbi:MAG: hydrogenase nickel incorporation protein HypB [Clostridiales bacterium]|nr:hydrogenase nickel incorporation protein HypB [Clostridiales bacterium]
MKLEDVKILEVKASICEDNDIEADRLRNKLKKQKTALINVMSGPGSGKTSMILRIIEELKDKVKIGVIEADIDSDVDALKIAGAGADAIQLHTDGMCHLDAGMTEQGLDALGSENYDICFLENVGNLVCPAEFDTGATSCICILSVPEGDDKPLKYPLMFSVCDVLVINKIDVADYFDFDMEKVIESALVNNPKLKIFPVSAKTGEGFEPLLGWVLNRIIK